MPLLGIRRQRIQPSASEEDRVHAQLLLTLGRSLALSATRSAAEQSSRRPSPSPDRTLARSLTAQPHLSLAHSLLRRQPTSPVAIPRPSAGSPSCGPADLRRPGTAPVHGGGHPRGRVRACVPHHAPHLHPVHRPSAHRPPRPRRCPALRPHRLLTAEVATRMGFCSWYFFLSPAP
jgi:hypothetical protein